MNPALGCEPEVSSGVLVAATAAPESALAEVWLAEFLVASDSCAVVVEAFPGATQVASPAAQGFSSLACAFAGRAASSLLLRTLLAWGLVAPELATLEREELSIT